MKNDLVGIASRGREKISRLSQFASAGRKFLVEALIGTTIPCMQQETTARTVGPFRWAYDSKAFEAA